MTLFCSERKTDQWRNCIRQQARGGGKLEESYEENLKRDAKENVAAAAVHGLLCKLRKPLNGRKN